MRLVAYLLFMLLPVWGFSVEKETSDFVVRMDKLIAATEASVQRQKALRELLIQYKEKEKKAISNPDDTDNLLQLVDLAKKVKSSIEENFLQDYFPPQFLQELDKLSKIAKQKNIPPAK